MPPCRSCGHENPEHARFCLACGSSMAPPREERKLVTALYTDVVGSTARGEQLDPEDVRARLAPFYTRLRRELERFGGTVEKFIGDAVVALFGAPVAHEDDPERAVRAALAIRQAVAELNAADPWLDLHVRIGVNTGEAFVVLGARPAEGEVMASGDVMNTVSRLQAAAPTDGILVGDATYRATTGSIDYGDAEPVRVKGKAAPVRVWEAVAAKEGVPRRTPSRLPLLGREAELESLSELWAGIRDEGRPVLATIVGPPGVGKTRLVTEFCAQVQPHAPVYWGRCLSYREGATYWPVTEVVRDAAGILQGDDEETVSAKLGVLLAALDADDADDADDLRTIAAALSHLTGAALTSAGAEPTAQIGRSELHWGIRRLLELVARHRPVLLVLEDLQWAEPTLLDLVRYVADGAGAPIAVFATARPELAESHPLFLAVSRNRHVLELEALGRRESKRLVAELLGPRTLPDEAVETLLLKAGGNPLFLEETIRMLIDSELLDGGNGAVKPEALPVPGSLQALIGSRLDRLPTGEKQLAQLASVVGTVFWPGALVHLDHSVGPDLAGCLATLEQRDIVRAHKSSSVAGEREYAFKHVLIRDVAYGQLPKGRRAELHLRFAEWTRTLSGSADEFVELVAYHLEQACRLARQIARTPVEPPIEAAVDALIRAAEKAERCEGLHEADRFYTRGLELAGEDGGAAVRLRLGRGLVLLALGALAGARGQLLGVVEEARALGRSDLLCKGLLALANAESKRGEDNEARRHLREAEKIAREIGDRRLQIQAAYELAIHRSWFEGAGVDVGRDLRRALGLAVEIDDLALRVDGHIRLGMLFANKGELVEAENHLAEGSALAAELGSIRDQARATMLLAFVKYNRGELEEAEGLALQAREWLERTGESIVWLQNLRQLAVCALARGDAQLAEQRVREALPVALETGGWLVIELYRYLAEALVQQDRIDDARALLDLAARDVPKEDVYARACLLVARATVATAEHDAERALASWPEAVRLYEDLDLQVDLVSVRRAYARALRRFGDPAAARAELERARETILRVGATRLVPELDRELAESSDSTNVPRPAGAA